MAGPEMTMPLKASTTTGTLSICSVSSAQLLHDIRVSPEDFDFDWRGAVGQIADHIGHELEHVNPQRRLG